MLSTIDYVVLGAYLILIAAVGLYAGRQRKTADGYFLASRSVPWWAAGISILATETSALTFIGGPIQSLRGDWTYLQLALGSALARFLVAGLLIGAYYRADVTTVYGFLGERFGPRSRDLGSVLFFIGRTLGSGVRLYGGAIALVVVADVPFPIAIVLIALIALFYTLMGGLRSVIWTDFLQAMLLVGGAAIALWYLVQSLMDGGQSWGQLWQQVAAAQTADGASKLRVINLSLDPTVAYTLAAGLIGSTFLTLSTHGTDQDMIQRALACKDEKDGRRSMWLSAALIFPVNILFLAIGSLLWLKLGGDQGSLDMATRIATAEGLATPAKGFDFLFPVYLIEALPAGLRGLIIAALFATAMSSLDSAISALSTTAVKNFWKPYWQPKASDADEVRVARWLSAGFAGLLVLVALIVWRAEGSGSADQGFGVLMLGLKVLSWIFPPLLGIFLLGVLTRRGRDLGNLLAVGLGIGTLLTLEFWPALTGQPTPVAWIWNPVIGCLLTFGLAAVWPRATSSTTFKD